MTRLTDLVTSDYVKAMNRLMPQKNKKKIVAYVESYEDVAFWRLLLDEFESPQITFQIMLPGGEGIARGKRSAINSMIQGNALGKYMIACVDSDYDYALQGETDSSAQMLQNPYILQTYTYSIENYQCYAGSLGQICVQNTLNDRRVIDFEVYMEMYSQAIFPLFAWNILFYRKKMHSLFPMHEFNRIICMEDIKLDDPLLSIEMVRRRVQKKTAMMEKSFPQYIKEVRNLMEELPHIGITPQTTYLFVQGHQLKESIIKRLIAPICSLLAREREIEIQKKAIHEQQMHNELQAYRHTQIPLAEAFSKNTHYRDSFTYGRMREQARRIISAI